jgi:hypothetical protein
MFLLTDWGTVEEGQELSSPEEKQIVFWDFFPEPFGGIA